MQRLNCLIVVVYLMGIFSPLAHAQRCIPLIESMPGFPVMLPNIGGSPWSNAVTSANVADLDDDGDKEIIFGRADNTLYVFDWMGNNFPGFPTNFGGLPGWGIAGEPALYDLDNKGQREIIFATNGLPPGNTTYLHVYKHTGIPFSQWPLGGVVIGTNSRFTPAGADLQNNGRRQIIIDNSNTSTGSYYMNVFAANGVMQTGFPIAFNMPGGSSLSSPSVANMSGSKNQAIFFGGKQGDLHAVNHLGNKLSGWPTAADQNTTPALGDIDGDGRVDIVTSLPNTSGKPAGIVVYDQKGNVLPGWPQYDSILISSIYSSPSLADLDGDGRLEIIIYINEPQQPSGGAIHVWHADGGVMTGWPQAMETMIGLEDNVTIADVDHDGDLELAAIGTGVQAKLYVFNTDGSLQAGFPYLLPINSASWAMPTLADLNGDGSIEIVFTWFENNWSAPLLAFAQLEVLQIRDCGQTDKADAAPWPQFKHDPAHSGFISK